jgi:hypothetical protein
MLLCTPQLSGIKSRPSQTVTSRKKLRKIKVSSRITTRCLLHGTGCSLNSWKATRQPQNSSLVWKKEIHYLVYKISYTEPEDTAHASAHTNTHTHYIALSSTLRSSFYTSPCFANCSFILSDQNNVKIVSSFSLVLHVSPNTLPVYRF